MYVEDLFLKLYEKMSWGTYSPIFRNLTVWQRDFIGNVAGYLHRDSPLSTKQSLVVLKIISDCRQPLVNSGVVGEADLDNLLRNPQYRQALYESTNVPKEVRYLGGNLLGFRFKKNDILRDKIKALCTVPRTTWLSDAKLFDHLISRTRFNWTYRIWIVPVYRYNIMSITHLLAESRFQMDQDARDYLRLARRSLDTASLFAVDDENQIILANVCDNPILSGWITEVAGGLAL